MDVDQTLAACSATCSLAKANSTNTCFVLTFIIVRALLFIFDQILSFGKFSAELVTLKKQNSACCLELHRFVIDFTNLPFLNPGPNVFRNNKDPKLCLQRTLRALLKTKGLPQQIFRCNTNFIIGGLWEPPYLEVRFIFIFITQCKF